MRATNPSPPDEPIKVWDLLVRATHWLLAILFVVAYTSEDLMSVHRAAGYAIIAIVAVRVVWGFVGSQYARFAEFVRSPRQAIAYLRRLADGTAPRTLGHNPAGGLMILALLAALLVASITGWLIPAGASRNGDWIKDLHEFAANATLVLILLHVVGVVVSSLRHNENLVKAMITGRKERREALHRPLDAP